MLFGLIAVLAGLLFLLRCLCAFWRESDGANPGAILPTLNNAAVKIPRKEASMIHLAFKHEPATPAIQHGTRKAQPAQMLRIVGIVFFATVVTSLQGQEPSSNSQTSEVEQLKILVLQLQSRVEQLEKEKAASTSPITATSSPTDPRDQSQTGTAHSALTADDRSILDYLHGTTINFALDGYYGYNFNQPIGRVNLLRAYDVSSNSFSLSQANLILEQAPDVSAGRRFGARIDFQYGQATETLQGSAANELRPQAYRPLFQAYGTYVAPVGSGLTIDFGKFGSSLGFENNYTKDQINYSRSYYFNFLPFYHMGFRTTYNFTPNLSFAYWLVNGAQQTEAFSGSKSQGFIFTIKPRSTVSWNVNYFFGDQQRDVVPNLNPGFPTEATQPGLPVANISPAPDGKEHIFDTYISWNTTPKLTLAAEADYVINRVFSQSAPTHVDGAAGYIRYQLTPKFAVATRAEYLSDRGGLFSGVTQALKENTVTTEYKFAEGFLARAEYRRDYSNRPFFLSDVANKLKKNQDTATLGLVWWMGRKQGSW